MKKLIIFAFVSMTMMTNAQTLTLKNKYNKEHWPKNEYISTKNKPNGYIFRLREEIQCKNLPLTSRVKVGNEPMELVISETIPNGWMALYRNDFASDDYDFVIIFYDINKKPIKTIDLCKITHTYNCEVQDVRWDESTRCLMFNMACPSYAKEINGKGSKLFCYNIDNEEIQWETPYLTSNGIFTYNDKFVFCSYGFTNEKDYVFMLDKSTGKILSKILVSSALDYLELQIKKGQEFLYCIDYRESLYIYQINY